MSGYNKENNSFSFQYFDLNHKSQSMVEMDARVLNSEGEEFKTRWLHSPDDCDLFFWQDKEQNIVRIQMNISGQVMDWNIIQGLRSGILIEEEYIDMNQIKLKERVRYDAKLQKNAINCAKKIITEVPILSFEDKTRIINCLEDAKLNHSKYKKISKQLKIYHYLYNLFKRKKE